MSSRETIFFEKKLINVAILRMIVTKVEKTQTHQDSQHSLS
jgi:hypothetical protein